MPILITNMLVKYVILDEVLASFAGITHGVPISIDGVKNVVSFGFAGFTQWK